MPFRAVHAAGPRHALCPNAAIAGALRDTSLVKRERAVLLLEQMLQTLDQCKSARPLSLVTGVYVFGSFARGALEPHDVDIDIEYEPDWDWGAHIATCLSYGRDPHGPMKRMLIRGKRGCQFQFNFRDRADFGMTPLWHRGDTLQMALYACMRSSRIRPLAVPCGTRCCHNSRDSMSGYHLPSARC